jgi:WD40 repeat protein
MGNLAEYLNRLPLARRMYKLQAMPKIFAQSSDVGSLYSLLTDFDFIEAKVSDLGTQALIEDYDLAFNPDVSLPGEKVESLRLIQGAIRLSAHILDQDKTQLSGQLLGRLMSFKVPEIQTMLEQAKQWKAVSWLRPLTPSLMPPGISLLRTFLGHTRSVKAIAIAPDGQQVVSVSDDNTFKVWDLDSGKELKTLTRHTNSVYTTSVKAVAITSDGQRVISVSDDNTFKVWDLNSGKELKTLTGHTNSVIAVAITSDGQQVISTSRDNTLKLWDLESGKVIASFSGDGALNCCAVAPNGVTIAAGEASGRVHFLRLEGV